MIDAVGSHRPHECHLVHDLLEVGEQLGDLAAVFAAIGEFPRAGQKRRATSDSHRRDRPLETWGQRLTGVSLQTGLIIEQIKMARTAVHKKPDDRFCGWMEVRRNLVAGGRSAAAIK